ncbi:hypothetical protein [Kitasatospora sp. DSM 101779]|uniref:hypothetical protein n=1 Tax=Kitasatospora sp. DSM 101779 TaxID=2853165 RepID=UPI0021D7E7AB|nr:hypothetical protein [Kitasatospora sp. DSM 101779]MCU7827355.1 hypothetical protein [Kitasatospora sp. DSM 101779]
MYLIHVRLRAAAGAVLPPDVAGIFTSFADGDDSVEHIAVHPDAPDGPTLGLFLAAPSLAAAEAAAARLSRRAVAGHASLRGFAVVASEAPLLPGPWWGTA